MSNERIIWDRLISAQGPSLPLGGNDRSGGLPTAQFTPAGAAGLMGNLQAESGLNPVNLQNTCEAKLGFTDEGYTVAVDNGTYTNFVHDGAGYGLAQWTHWSRKAELLAFSRDCGRSIGNLEMQVDYLLQELTRFFPVVLGTLQTTNSVKNASDCVLLQFERPASVKDAQKLQETRDRRAALAQEFHDKFAKTGGNGLKLLKCILTENDCYKNKYTIKPKGVMVHSTGANNPYLRRYVQPVASAPDWGSLLVRLGFNPNGNHWNRPGTNACVHAFIGRLADGSVAAVQTLPWNHRGWHAAEGKKGSANDGYISFEMCEDGLTDPVYFGQAYQAAVELTAMLCREYGLDPLADGVVICHQDGYRRGIASNHGDVYNWFPKHGKTMDDFRADVARVMKGENDMNEEQIRRIVRDECAKMEAERAELPASAWAQEELAAAVEAGITDGQRPQSHATRQEVAIMVGRLGKMG